MGEGAEGRVSEREAQGCSIRRDGEKDPWEWSIYENITMEPFHFEFEIKNNTFFYNQGIYFKAQVLCGGLN